MVVIVVVMVAKNDSCNSGRGEHGGCDIGGWL